MLILTPVKIPYSHGKIRFMKKEDGREYVLLLKEREYNTEKKYSEPKWILIGKRISSMPGLMYPNQSYEDFFEREANEMEEELTTEELLYIHNKGIYDMYDPFFDSVFHEIKQQSRKNAEKPLNQYKVDSINKILQPLLEMMKDEEYAGLLSLIKTGESYDEKMSYSDVMILLTQYKSALTKYHRSHP